MAAPTAKKDVSPEEKETGAAPTQPSAPARRWGLRWLASRWSLILLVLLIVLNAIGLATWRLGAHGPAAPPDPEIALGTFRFLAEKSEQGPIRAAEFVLHVALTAELDRQGRAQLAARKFRVQQDVEELLRRAHGGDFDDPKLRGLKRQLQAQINETLGMDAIAEVIITGFSAQGHGQGPGQRAAAVSRQAPSSGSEG